jgi:hypothetical protein
LYSSYTCAMNAITVNKYGMMMLWGSTGVLRVVKNQTTNPPANSRKKPKANGPTNMYSNATQPTLTKAIGKSVDER